MQTFVLPSEALADDYRFDSFEELTYEDEHPSSARFHSIDLQDFHVLIDEQLKSEIVELQGLCSIPFTPQWFIGVINVRGNSVPIIELEDYLGYKRSASKLKYTLIINNGTDSCGILLRSLPKAVAFEQQQAIKGHFNISPALEKHLLQMYEDTGIWLHIDIPGLFNEAFSQLR